MTMAVASSEAKETENDLNFVYGDCDSYTNEISELYAYTEEEEFQLNLSNFSQLLQSKGFSSWKELGKAEKSGLLMHIIQVLEVSDYSERYKAVTCLLYLVQGVYGECTHVAEQISNCQDNCYLLYQHGIFAMVQELLVMEINGSNMDVPSEKKSSAPTIEDSKMLRGTISILYTMVETFRRELIGGTEERKQLKKEFLCELEQGLNDKEPLVIALFEMISKFCCQVPSPYPMKKVLLLTWKLLLTILGGFENLQQKKVELRQEAGLSILTENPLQIVRDMKASTPPTNATDLLEVAQGRKKGKRSVLYEFDAESSDIDASGSKSTKNETDGQLFEEEKVTSIDDVELPQDGATESILKDEDSPLDETNGVVKQSTGDGDSLPPPTPGIMTPVPSDPSKDLSLNAEATVLAAKLRKEFRRQQEAIEMAGVPVLKVVPGLPWVPKARKRDVEAFLNLVRQKFIGFALPGDLTTVAGLPNPTQDSIRVLRKHLYIPFSDLQIEREAEISKFPMTMGKSEIIPDTVTERLYQAMLPNLPQYMIALLKILLAAAPTAKPKNDSINILSDILPKDMPTTAVMSLKLGIDVNRHREIIVKAISGLLLLLLKHFNLSHVYQFEYTSQHLVFANCIPLILKFFNQNIVAYVTTKNTIPCLEFPACVIGSKPEITSETFEDAEPDVSPCWRNMFSSINLLRILNKLVKWKHSRTMMLVVFKSAPILKKALKIRHGMFQLYVLKLLKVQTKFLGRAWRKNNMKTISAIYQKVRHRLNDDWAFGNDLDARPWDFQQEECALRTYVERFNVRRYKITGNAAASSMGVSVNEEFAPVNNNMQNLLSEEVEFPLEFRKSYDVWLEREVYHASTDWDVLLKIPCIQ